MRLLNQHKSLLLTICLAFFACSKDPQAVNSTKMAGQDTGPIAFENLALGIYSEAPVGEVNFNNEDDWEAFWAQLTSFEDPSPSLPAVDFSERQVVGFVKDYPDGEVCLKIEAVVESEESVAVVVKVHRYLETLANTRPYHVVSIPRTEMAIKFEVEASPDEEPLTECSAEDDGQGSMGVGN